MGNCAFKGNHGNAGRSMIIRVATCNDGVMELFPPVTAECITNGFPGHAIYRSCDALSLPLMHSEELVGGELYYLRPINSPLTIATTTSNVIPQSSMLPTPYRVSFDQHGFWRKQDNSSLDQVGTLGYGGGGTGMWKVKLAISPAQLAEILSQESRTEALIESVRTVAKCGNGSATSVASSDQWSLASSRKDASMG